MPWLKLILEVDHPRGQELADALEEHGAAAVTIEDAGDQPVFEPAAGATPLWPRNRITALLAQDADVGALMAQLARQTGLELPYRTEELADQDWERAWMERYRPLHFGGRLWVCPSWIAPPDPGAVNVLIDPGLAFGTGTHTSTALCLEWLAAHPPAALSVIDYGCGSGILAIAALKLGARTALGVDSDPQALTVSAENAARNAVAARYRGALPQDVPAGLQADLVLANILAEPLIALAPRLTRLVRPGGRLLLAGILEDQAATVAAHYAPHFALDPPQVREHWALLAGRRIGDAVTP